MYRDEFDDAKDLRVPFGRRTSDRRMCEPRDVPLGKACGCVCPGCGEPLVAKHCLNGDKIPHFAHRPGVDCTAGYMSALHAAATQLILDRMELFVPTCEAVYTTRDLDSNPHTASRVISPAQLLRFTQAAPEKTVEDTRPDLLAETPIGQLNIEVAVTHFINPEKLEKLQRLKLATVELDLSELDRANFEHLGNILFSPNEHVRWVHHPEVSQFLAQAQNDLAPALTKINAEITQRRAKEDEEHQRQRAAWAIVCEEHQRQATAAKRARNQALYKELKRAHEFRDLPEAQKMARVLDYLGPPPSDFLTKAVRGADSFGVKNPLVWQLALVGNLISNAVRRGHTSLNVDFAAQWMAHRFNVAPAFPNADKVAIWDCLVGLEGLRVLQRSSNGYFLIRIASYSSLMSLIAHQKRFLTSLTVAQSTLCLEWAPESAWPNPEVSAALTNGRFGYGWDRLAVLLPDARLSNVETVVEHYGHIADARVILEYLIAAGFIRTKQPAPQQ